MPNTTIIGVAWGVHHLRAVDAMDINEAVVGDGRHRILVRAALTG